LFSDIFNYYYIQGSSMNLLKFLTHISVEC
jgi:hypothetical protein